jgi:hypothetical protein
MPNRWIRLARCVVPFVLLPALSCGVVKKSPPPQVDVEALLKQQADEEKRDAEADVNPKLGVKVTWTIQSVEVRPQPGNEAQPYAGTIRFLVESKTPELDGVATERFDKAYEYLWDLEKAAWVPQ